MDKIYRLKKDLPTFNKGDEFELRSDGSLWLTNPITQDSEHQLRPIMAYAASTLQEFPDILAEDPEWFEEVINKAWTPAMGDNYWYISDTLMGVLCDRWDNHEIDVSRLAIGNVFRTKEEAEKALEWLKARKVLFDDTRGFKPNWDNPNEKKWYVWQDSDKCLDVDYRSEYSDTPGPYFAFETDAKASIKAHEKEWKIYLGVEE